MGSKAHRTMRAVRKLALRGMAALAAILMASAAGLPALAGELDQVLNRIPLSTVFPGADGAGAVSGEPLAAPVFRDGALAGYVLLTSDAVASVGYSGKPVKILVGLDLGGRITGAFVAEHREPILVLGISEARLSEFIAQFRGIDIRKRVRLGRVGGAGEVGLDMVSGASITSLVFNDSIVRAARLVARSRGILAAEPAGGGAIDVQTFREADWNTLVEEGSLGRLRLTNGQAERAFAGEQGGASPTQGSERDPEDVFIDLYTALATPAAIGQNLLGFAAYNALMAKLGPGAHAIFAAANGLYSFRGYTYRKTGFFERLRLVQGTKTLRLTKHMHERVDELHAAGAPEFRETSLFIIPADAGFDAARPWRLEVLAERATAAGGTAYASFPLNYELPKAYLAAGDADTSPGAVAGGADEEPLWLIRWLDNVVHLVVFGLALAGLLALLVFQDWVVRHKKLTDRLRLGFLVFTVLYVGWTLAAQLSVINVLTFINALLGGFHWEFFLLEPLIFILWCFVAVALLFWGRGVFCGWLCPFGALQELLNRVAIRLGIPQITIPFAVNERLWPIKYLIFLGLFALSLGPVELAEALTEVEPFKTAIALKFVRAWPFVLYAAGLLMVGLFVQRVFCRYLCPLGAALAIPATNSMFQWLKRRHQCGTSCHICAERCPVQAIHPEGRINLHECIYCLDCQSIYHDEHLCPPLVSRRKQRQQRSLLQQKVDALKAEQEIDDDTRAGAG